MISGAVSRSSALALLLGGLALLFLPDEIMPRLIPGYPPAGAWLGQLVAAAWLGLASLNWLNRGVLLGGIYARPVVVANAVCYFIAAASLLKVATREQQPGAFWLLAVPITLLAIVYAWLFFRGPFEADLAAFHGSPEIPR